MAFRLNEAPLLRQVFEGIPYPSIELVVEGLPIVYLPRLLRFVALQTEESPHLEFCLLWIKAILTSHGQWVSDNRGTVEAELRTVSRAVGRIRDELRRLADDNVYTLDYLLSQPVPNGTEAVSEKKSIENGTISENEDVEMNQDEGEESSEGEWLGLD